MCDEIQKKYISFFFFFFGLITYAIAYHCAVLCPSPIIHGQTGKILDANVTSHLGDSTIC